jgi:hypothetical protein
VRKRPPLFASPLQTALFNLFSRIGGVCCASTPP